MLLMILCFTMARSQNEQYSRKELNQYGQQVLDTLKANSIYSNRLDLDSARSELSTFLKDKEDKSDLIPFFERIYEQLGDFHGAYYYQGKGYGMEAKNVEVPDNLKNGFKLGAKVHSGILHDRYAYLFIPPISPKNQQERTHYIEQIQKEICSFYDENMDYLIIDLKLNLGGDMYAMLGGLIPFLDDDVYGYFINDNSKPIPWSVLESKVYFGDEQRTDSISKCPKNTFKKIAVLISPLTCSSGEALAISLKQLDNSILIGESTSAYTAASDIISIDEEIKLLIAVAYMADSNKKYDEFIEPDIVIGNEHTDFEKLEEDLFIKESIKWFNN